MSAADTPHQTSHATALQISGKGVLLRGASRSGKSSIAMRLLDDCRLHTMSGFLIADDRVFLDKRNDGLYAISPDELRGLLEIRGLGIVHVDHLKEARLDLIVDLVPADNFERYPEEGAQNTIIKDVALARIHIVERNPDAAAIIRMFLHAHGADGFVKDIEI